MRLRGSRRLATFLMIAALATDAARRIIELTRVGTCRAPYMLDRGPARVARSLIRSLIQARSTGSVQPPWRTTPEVAAFWRPSPDADPQTWKACGGQQSLMTGSRPTE
jgi:hypothetical protein